MRTNVEQTTRKKPPRMEGVKNFIRRVIPPPKETALILSVLAGGAVATKAHSQTELRAGISNNAETIEQKRAEYITRVRNALQSFNIPFSEPILSVDTNEACENLSNFLTPIFKTVWKLNREHENLKTRTLRLLIAEIGLFYRTPRQADAAEERLVVSPGLERVEVPNDSLDIFFVPDSAGAAIHTPDKPGSFSFTSVVDKFRKLGKNVVGAFAGAFTGKNGKIQGTAIVEGQVVEGSQPSINNGFLVIGKDGKPEFVHRSTKELTNIDQDIQSWKRGGKSVIQLLSVVHSGKNDGVMPDSNRTGNPDVKTPRRALVEFTDGSYGIIDLKNRLTIYEMAQKLLEKKYGGKEVKNAFYLDMGEGPDGYSQAIFVDQDGNTIAAGDQTTKVSKYSNVIVIYFEKPKKKEPPIPEKKQTASDFLRAVFTTPDTALGDESAKTLKDGLKAFFANQTNLLMCKHLKEYLASRENGVGFWPRDGLRLLEFLQDNPIDSIVGNDSSGQALHDLELVKQKLERKFSDSPDDESLTEIPAGIFYPFKTKKGVVWVKKNKDTHLELATFVLDHTFSGRFERVNFSQLNAHKDLKKFIKEKEK